jgi:group I intron endonuclease
MYLIYALKNKCNPKIYVGQTKHTLKQRWSYGNGYKDCTLIERAINKYGADNFYYEVITVCETQAVADYWEEFFINKFDARNTDVGYNVAIGGASGFTGLKHSEETRQKISVAKTGHCEANSGSFQTGSIPWHAGKIGVYSDEALSAMSNARKGKPPANKGVPRSKETKLKLSVANKGKKQTEETKKKRSESMKRTLRDKKLKSTILEDKDT